MEDMVCGLEIWDGGRGRGKGRGGRVVGEMCG